VIVGQRHQENTFYRKTLALSEDRDAQFENIGRLKREYESSDNPIISFDTKKKEQLGNYYREGYLYTTQVMTLTVSLMD